MKKSNHKIQITFTTNFIFSGDAVHLTIAHILFWDANTWLTMETFAMAPYAKQTQIEEFGCFFNS